LVKENLSNLDVGYLALNAGISSGGKFFADAEDELVESVMNINGLHVVYMAKAMLTMMLARDKRSAIVITSSIMSYFGLAASSTYAATKAMERLFGESLHYELKPKIDVITFTPGYVDTKLLNREKASGNSLPLLVTAEASVRAIHKDLGKFAVSAGDVKHKVMLYFLNKLHPKEYFYQRIADSKRKATKKS
jgi:short-subunit dehydrogenase